MVGLEHRVSLANDWVQVWGFTANSEVTFEFFDCLGGSRLFGPETLMTDDDGHIWLDASDHGVDLASGMAVISTDEATGTVKTPILCTATSEGRLRAPALRSPERAAPAMAGDRSMRRHRHRTILSRLSPVVRG
jgi:hypothetical protein